MSGICFEILLTMSVIKMEKGRENLIVAEIG